MINLASASHLNSLPGMEATSMSQAAAMDMSQYSMINSVSMANTEAQLQYETQRRMAQGRSRDAMDRAGAVRTMTAGDAVRFSAGRMLANPERQDYLSAEHEEAAAGNVIAQRAIQAPMAAAVPIGKFALETASYYGGERVMNKFMGSGFMHGNGMGAGVIGSANRAMLKAGVSQGTSRALLATAGGVAKFVGPQLIGMAAIESVKAGLNFAGVPGALNQFEGNDQVREMSSQFMAGSRGDPLTGRASRRQSAQMMNHLHEVDRSGFFNQDGADVNELKADLGKFTEAGLMDGTKDIDDFKRKFGSLREGVKKMAEALGTTFTESVELMAGFRRAGVSPDQIAAKTLEFGTKARSAASAHGLPVEAVLASGAQGAMAVQGTGLSYGAGFSMGTAAVGHGKTIYEEGLLSSRQIFNMGGPDGLHQTIQNAQASFVQSQAFTLGMMGSDGAMNPGMAGDLATGRQSFAGMMQQGVGSISSVEDLMEFKAGRNTAISETLEESPETISAMAVAATKAAIESLGIDTDGMKAEVMAQYATNVGTASSSEEFMAHVGVLRSAESTIGRGDQLENVADRERGRRLHDVSFVGRAGESFRRDTAGIAAYGADLQTETRNMVYDAAEGMARSWEEGTSGRVRTNMSQEAVDALKTFNVERPEGEVSSKGLGYIENNSWFNMGQGQDTALRNMMNEGFVSARSTNVAQVFSGDTVWNKGLAALNPFAGNQVGADGGMSMSQEQLDELGVGSLSAGMEQTGMGRYMFTNDQLVDAGLTVTSGSDSDGVRSNQVTNMRDVREDLAHGRALSDNWASAREDFDATSPMTTETREAYGSARSALANRLGEKKGSSTRGQQIAASVRGGLILTQEIEHSIAQAKGLGETNEDGVFVMDQARVAEYTATDEGQQMLGRLSADVASDATYTGVSPDLGMHGDISLMSVEGQKKAMDEAEESTENILNTYNSSWKGMAFRIGETDEERNLRNASEFLQDDRETSQTYMAQVAALRSARASGNEEVATQMEDAIQNLGGGIGVDLAGLTEKIITDQGEELDNAAAGLQLGLEGRGGEDAVGGEQSDSGVEVSGGRSDRETDERLATVLEELGPFMSRQNEISRVLAARLNVPTNRPGQATGGATIPTAGNG